jgi:hypothetical protein
MTYYRKQRMESFKKAMFASHFSDKYLKPALPNLRRLLSPVETPRQLVS